MAKKRVVPDKIDVEILPMARAAHETRIDTVPRRINANDPDGVYAISRREKEAMVKSAALDAFDRLGGAEWLAGVARENPMALIGMLSRIIPIQQERADRMEADALVNARNIEELVIRLVKPTRGGGMEDAGKA